MPNTFCGCEHCKHQLCAHRVPIFSTLAGDELGRVAALIIHKEYLKGEFLLLEGERLESLVIINQGQVKAFRDNPEGREQILYIFSEGDFFGEKNLLTGQEATYQVQALETTRICMIRQRDFQALLTEYPGIGLKIILELSNRLEKLEKTIQHMGSKNVDARVGSVLLEFARKYGKAQTRGIEIDLPLSREGIASYIGLTRETVSRKMSLLQEEGLIEMIGNKKVLLRDPAALEASLETYSG